MKPQSAKNKGRKLQQKVVQSILDTFPHLHPADCFSTSMGAGGEDVRMSPLCRQRVPLSIECKRHERLNVWSCLEQATTNAPEGAHPCLIFSRNRAKTYAVVEWEYLLKLVSTRGSEVPPQLAALIRAAAALLP